MKEYLMRLWQQFRVVDPHDAGNLASSNVIQEKYKHEERFGKLPRNNIKVQILGDAGVGKTSLRKKLSGEKFNPNEGKTVGVETRMCESVDVNESWRQINSEENEYKYKMAWLIAKSVVKESEKGGGHGNERGGLLPFFMIAFFIVLSSCANFTLYFNFYLANRYVFSLLIFFLTFLSFLNTILSYKMAAGFSLALVFMGKLANFNTEYAHSFEDPQISKLLFCGILGLISVSGLVIGIILSTSFCNSMLIAFSITLAPAYVDEGTGQSYPALLSMMLGFASGFFLHKVYIYLRGKRVNQMPFQKKITCAIVVQIILISILIVFRVLTPWTSVFAHNFISFTLSSFGLSLGVEFGPTINGVLRLGRPLLLPVRMFAGIIVAYICGHEFPTSFTLTSVVAVLSGLLILSVELYRSNSAERGHDVPIRFVTQHIIRQRELKQTDLPVQFSLWDFAGDEFFYNTHQVFIAAHAIYLVVFNLEECVDDNSMKTVLQRLQFWLHSICTHTANPNSLIFIVGTHRNSVDENVRQKVAEYLGDKLYYNSSRYTDHLAINSDNTPLWVIENSKTTDDDTVKLQKAIRKHCNDVTVIKNMEDDQNTDYPVHWLKFQNLLKDDISRNPPSFPARLASFLPHRLSGLTNTDKTDALCNKKIITFKDAFQYAQTHCGVTSREEMIRMLQFFHDAGHIIYIHNDQTLRQYVLTKPSLLIDAFKMIVNIPEAKDRKPSLASKWNRLSKEGIIHHKLLVNILGGITEHVAVLLMLLQCYDFLCPSGRITSSSYGFEVEEYIIPSMRPRYRGNAEDLGPVRPFKRFYFDFGFFKPDSIFSRLSSKCIHIAQSYKIYRNVASFSLEDFSFRLDVTENSSEQHCIEVTIASVQDSNPYELLARLNSYIQAIRWRDFPQLTYQCGILCQFPHHPEDSPNEDTCTLHILPLCHQDKDFPNIGSTITRHCNGAPQTIELKPTYLKEKTNEIMSDDISSCQRPIASDVNIAPEDNPDLFDIYISCSPRDDVWVKDTLVRILESREQPLYVKVNSYKNLIENSKYIRHCAVQILIVNRFSATDARWQEERELMYYQHEASHVIHIITDKHKKVTELREKLPKRCVCLEYLSAKMAVAEQVFYEELHDLITEILE